MLACTPDVAARSRAVAVGSAILIASASCAHDTRAPAPMPLAARASAQASPAPSMEGTVTTASGDPLPGALVSVWSHFDPETRDPVFDTTSDERGHFRFAKLPPGRCAVTATGNAAAAYSGMLEVLPSAPTLHVALRTTDVPQIVIEGTVRDENGAPVANARMTAASFRENEDEVYVARADARGRYHYALPAGVAYLVVADAPPRTRAHLRVDTASTDANLTVGPAPAPRPSADTVLAWLHARATPLSRGAEPNDAEARAFAAIVGDAPLVAMGEATHGSAEFAEWRRKVFQMLVRDKGFTVYAIEAGWPDAFALDDYVLHGKGEPAAAAKAIRRLTTWVSETTEMLALVKWMRDYNADATHTKKLHFEAFDVYTPHAVPLLIAYLAKVDPDAKELARATLAPFASIGCDSTYPALEASTQAATRRAVDALLASLDEKRRAYVARSSEEEWARARQLARHVRQAEASYRDEALREPYMAENIRWLMSHHAPGTRALLYAHNAHIAASGHGELDLGRLLRNEWGNRYVAIGFSFGEGTTRALDWRNGRRPDAPLRTFTVARAPEDTFDGALGLAKLPAFVVDLRTADGPLAAWLASPQPLHEVRGWYGGPDHVFETFAPARAFDAMVYVDHVSASHALEAGNAVNAAK